MAVGILDVISPYFFVGFDLGSGIHDALALLHVDEYDTAYDDDAVVIWGVCRMDSSNPGSPFFSPRAGGGHAQTPPNNNNSSDDSYLQWEWHDVAIRFRATVARNAAASLPAAQVTKSGVADVLNALGGTTGRSDYPNTQFRIELMFELVSVTFPKLIGAKLEGSVLVPDPDNTIVKISLPRVLLILTQDSAADTTFDVSVGSWGADTLDDADPAIADLIRMTPSYALTKKGQQFGIGFQKAILDLSDSSTPPDVLDQFGLGDDWQGIYVPELLLFISTQKSAGVAINVGAREMLIGLDPTPGLWGEFNIDVDLLGDKLQAGLRLYGVSGDRYDPELVKADDSAKADRYKITVPSTAGPDTENYVLFVDISSGAAPFVITAVAGEDHPTDLTQIPDDSLFSDSSHHPEDISTLQRIRLSSQDQRVAIRITSSNPQQKRVLVLDIYPDYQKIASTQPPPPDTPKATLTIATKPTSSSNTVVLNEQNDQQIIISPANGVLTIDGAAVPVVNGVATFPSSAGQSKNVEVTWAQSGEEELDRYTVFFEYNKPWDGDTGSMRTQGSLQSLVAQYNATSPADRKVRIDAYASRENGAAQSDHNKQLSQNRADYLVTQLSGASFPTSDVPSANIGSWGNEQHPSEDSSIDVSLIDGQVPNNHSAEADWEQGNNPNYKAEDYRIATVTLLKTSHTQDSYKGTLQRADKPPVTQTHPQEPPTPKAQQPRWLRHIGGTVRFEREAWPVAAELRMSVDFQTAHEDGLNKFRDDINVIGPGLQDPDEQKRLPTGDPNPEDGVVDFRFAITHDPSTDTFTETLSATAGAGDRDGLWSWGSIPAADATGEPDSNGWRDILGLYFTLAPLLATSAADAANDGSVVPLVIGLSTPVVITTLGIAHVLRFTHYGVELDVKHDQDEVHASLIFDVESAIWLNLKIGSFVVVTNRPDKPAKIRYKAVGFALNAQPSAPTSFLPVFDSSRGYTIDLSDSGSLKVLPSLGSTFGDIIQVLGARIARTNPLNIEVDLGMGVDLGVFAIDKFSFRLPIDPLGTPSITALGVSVDIKDVLNGKGYLQIGDSGFAGQLDLTLTSVGVRVAGGLAIRTVTDGDRSATATMVTIGVEFPSGIPLGGTGLAIFGFLGLFAMHHKRDENTSARDPALDWLVNKVAGDPTDLRGWVPQLDQWAFGVGLVAGTIEGGTVLNLKGMLILELPGPRVVLFVKANILTGKPKTKGTETGTLLAVVDVSPQRVLIGIQFKYHIEQVLDLVVPVEAGFFYDPPTYPPEHFYLDVGTIAQPVTAKILKLFTGTAYFMVHGDGIPDFALGALQGFSVATGFKVSFIWGNTDVGLYLKVDGGFDVGIGFKPLFFAGRLYIDGELRLFIVSIEAHGELSFRSDGNDTSVQGKICGHVDFFFFSVEGCVHFELGTPPGTPQVPDPVRDFMLQSRSYALLQGTGVDRGIDNVLCHGTVDGSVPTTEVRDNDQVSTVQVFVPIDTIPLVQFEVAPGLDDHAQIDGQLSSGLPPGFGEGWQKRGENYVRYTVKKIALTLISVNGQAVPSGTSPVTDVNSPRPYTWRHPEQQPGSDGLPVELALLDWKPTNVDKALVQGPALDSMVDSRWGRVCTPIAKAARVMWTFRYAPLGPSMDGWKLDGEAWPDDAGAYRSQEVNKRIKVAEIWRTRTFVDGLLPTQEATVAGIAMVCPQQPRRPLDVRTQLNDEIRLAAFIPGTENNDNDSASHATTAADATRTSAIIIQRRCVGKALQAPYELMFDSLMTSDDAILSVFKQMDEVRKEELRDVIRITGGPFVQEFTMLIYGRIKMVIKQLIKVRAYDKNGTELSGVSASFKEVTANAPLPADWTSTGGPWWDDIKLATALFEGSHMDKGGWGMFMVEVKLPSAAFIIDIGVSPLREAIDSFGMTPPSFYLAVIEGLAEAEVIREGGDNQEAGDDQTGLGDGLANKKHALLIPGGRYEVMVVYDGEIGAKPADPEEGQDPNEIVSLRKEEAKQSIRTFYTDTEPPRSLDPWMLAGYPSATEQYHFYEDPVVIVFATDDVLELYKAYKKQLRAVARAASFRGSNGTPEAAHTQFMIASFFQPMQAAILSPWEATVRRKLGLRTCGAFDPDNDQHGRAVLPMLLDPLTDYILDIEMLDANGFLSPLPPVPGEVGNRPLYRQSFTTSRYASREAFAGEVNLALVADVLLNDPTPLDALADVITDDVMDHALQAAGLGVKERPSSPRVSVLWNNGSPAQPLAIYIETPEPLWRMRKEPEAQYDESGNYIISWTLEDHMWLSVDELVRAVPSVLVIKGGDFVRRGTGTKTQSAVTLKEFRTRYIGPRIVDPLPPPPPPASFVNRFIRDTGGSRTLVMLKANSRGNTVSLGLARALNPLLDTDISDTPLVLCEVELKSAPWEGIL